MIKKNQSREELEKRRGTLLGQIEELKATEEELKEQNKIEFFKCDINGDFYYQAKTLEYLNAGKKTITLQGANQIGKTVLGAVITGSACLGIQPWDGKETIWGRKPVKVRIICADWDDHADKVIVPELKHWLPKGRYKTSKNNIGVESFWEFPDTGSTIELMTHGQPTSVHEGWKGDLVWADEPLPRDKYVANSRGLIAREGVFLLTMTAVSESWILDEIVLNPDPSFASVTEIPMNHNPTLSENAINQFAAKLLENEKIPRIQGGWLNLVGLIWSGFRKDAVDGKISHMIDPFNIPTDWPVIAIIDFHHKEPQAISYYAFDPQERLYVIDEEWKHMWAEETADCIIRKKKVNTWRLKDAFIDPLAKGDIPYRNDRGVEVPDFFSVCKERLWKHGIELHVASKDQSSGILNVEKMLNGPNGMPILFFFRSLNKIEKEGHIWEIQRWTYDEDKPKPNFHFMENLYRSTLTGVKYRLPRRKDEDFKSETEFRVFG